jgi:hypothetical protein
MRERRGLSRERIFGVMFLESDHFCKVVGDFMFFGPQDGGSHSDPTPFV